MKTSIRPMHQKMLLRPWKVKPWDFLPPNVRSDNFIARVTEGIPVAIRKRLANQGYSWTGFPYPRLGYLEAQPVVVDLETVVLENQRFRVVIASKLGPRIIEMHDKQFNLPLCQPFTSMNSSMIGLTGAWVLGGVEFNPFRCGHTPFFGQQAAVDEVRFADGERGLTFGALDELVNMEYRLTIRLFADRVSWRVRLVNQLAKKQPLYWYTNIAIPCGEDTTLLYEPGPVIHHALDPGFTSERWPLLGGRDWSRWGNHTNILSCYFHRYSKPYMGFFNPGSSAAMVHMSACVPLKGRKLWSLGARTLADIWWPRCYERIAGNYCEIQAGIPPTQLEYDWIRARGEIAWVESVAGFSFRPKASYQKTWSDFVRQADGLGILQDHALFLPWEVRRKSVVVPGSARQRNAALALAAMQHGNPEALRKLARDRNLKYGWVAGDAWGKVLRHGLKTGSASSWLRLHLAAQLSEKKRFNKALALLASASTGGIRQRKKNRLLSGLKLRLQAALFYRVGKTNRAVHYIEKGLAVVKTEPAWWREAFEYRRRLADIKGRRELLGKCPVNILKTDYLRFEAAHLYFDDGDFKRALQFLQREMFDVGEGLFSPWLLWRECWLAWGLELWERGDLSGASAKFFQAGQDAPQFGIGRRETEANMAPFFYRWWLASEHGGLVMANALAAQCLQSGPHPATESAAYLLRMAVAVGHKSRDARRRAIERWRRAERKAGVPEPLWRPAIMAAVSGSRPGMIWKRMLSDNMWKYRAAFESRHNLRIG